MLWRGRIGKLRLSFYANMVQDVIGVKSKVDKDRHVLMWDFDELSLWAIRVQLRGIQIEYRLPTIYILKGSDSNHHMAWCFTALSWRDTREIICGTVGVDEHFIRLAILRGYFALRVTKKNGFKPELATTLPSLEPEQSTIEDLREFFMYEAKQK